MIHTCVPLVMLQVYIVAMNRERERRQEQRASHTGEESPDKGGEAVEDFGSPPAESLLSLVQPEMQTLSRHWRAALKDQALLSLPPGAPLVTATCRLSLDELMLQNTRFSSLMK